jgi:hypothetical protein
MSNPNAPSSRQVTVGRTETGEQQATVTYRGGAAVNSESAYAKTLAVAVDNIEPMRRDAARWANVINERSSKVDPRTGQLPYKFTEEERKNAMLKLQQLSDSIAYQEAQAHAQARQAQAEADETVALARADYARQQLVTQRAAEISVELEAEALAKRLTISGGST